MVREAAAQPAAVAPLGPCCRSSSFVVELVALLLLIVFDCRRSLLCLELAAGARGLEDEGEGAAGGRGGRGGGLRVLLSGFFCKGKE